MQTDDVATGKGLTEMAEVRVANLTRGSILVERCRVADDLLTKAIGLLLTPVLEAERGLLLTRTATITMVGMRYPIDVVFVDRRWRVVGLTERLAPWVPVRSCRGASATLELALGAIDRSGTQVGDDLRAERRP